MNSGIREENSMIRSRLAVVAGIACMLFAALAQAQSFPNKPITLICPWPPGGSTDLHLRKLAEIASKHLGQNVIIENRPGGSGLNGPVGMSKTARPDGYTI